MRSPPSVEAATPDAAVDGHRSAVQRDREGEGRQDALADGAGDVRTAVDDDGELVAADAGDDVTGAHAAAQPLGEHEQELVAGGVTAAVVDVLEVVEVDEQQAHRTAALQDPVGDLLEQGAVGQAGQRVAEHLVLVEPPGGEVGEAGGEDERRRGCRPTPRGCARRRG